MAPAVEEDAAPEVDAEQAAILSELQSLTIDRTGDTSANEPGATRPEAATCPVSDARPGTAPGRWPVRASWYEGGRELERARRDSERAGAPLLLYFYTDWCGFCRRLDEGLLADLEVERYMRHNLVRLKVNPEAGPEDRDVALSFGVRGYPTLLLVTPRSGEAKRLSPYRRTEGEQELLDAEGFVRKFERAQLETRNHLLDTARVALESGSPSDALESADAALSLDPENPVGFAYRAQARLARGDLAAAWPDLRAVADRKPADEGPFALAATALGELGRWSESAACLGEALARKPEAGRFLERARAYAAAGDDAAALTDAKRACALGLNEACDWQTGRAEQG